MGSQRSSSLLTDWCNVYERSLLRLLVARVAAAGRVFAAHCDVPTCCLITSIRNFAILVHGLNATPTVSLVCNSLNGRRNEHLLIAGGQLR